MSQIEIFSKMLNVPETTVEDCLNGDFIKNTIRSEDNASVRMRYEQDRQTGMTKIRMTDFGDRRYSGDCFDIMGIILSVNVLNSKGFIEVCKAILNITAYKKILSQKSIVITQRQLTSISFIPRHANKYDQKWFNSYGLTANEAEVLVKCYCVDVAYINKTTPSYTYTTKDPCYAYVICKYGKDTLIKLYFPYRTKTSKYPRFITNNPFPFDDLSEFVAGDLLILVKSLKDKAVLIKHLCELPIFNQLVSDGVKITIIPVSSEAALITSMQARVLQNLFTLIITMFDFDRQGCYAANTYRKQFGFQPIMLTNGKFNSVFDYGAKDVSDYRKKYGNSKTLALLETGINTIRIIYETVATYR